LPFDLSSQLGIAFWLEMRAQHDIIHTVTSFLWRKVARASGKRAPMNCGHMIKMALRVAMTH